MARVTVEDCVEKVPNRFELVMMAAQRAREMNSGAQLTVDRDNDKNPVVALREIADETVVLDDLRESLIKGHQKTQDIDEPEEEIVELMAGEQALAPQTDENMAEEGALSADEDEQDTLDRIGESPEDSIAGEEGDLIDQNVDDEGFAYD